MRRNMNRSYDKISVFREEDGHDVEWQVIFTIGLMRWSSKVTKLVDGSQVDRWVLQSGEPEFFKALLNNERVSEAELRGLLPKNTREGFMYLIEELNRVFGKDFIQYEVGDDQQWYFFINPSAKFDFPNLFSMTEPTRLSRDQVNEKMDEIMRDWNTPARHTLQ